MASVLSRIPFRNSLHFPTISTKYFIRLHYKSTKSEYISQKRGRFSEAWTKLFGKYLLATNVISSGILMMAGDVLSQKFEHRKKNHIEKYDWERIARMFIVGSIQGPLHHYFYKWMDERMPVATIATTSWKILLDQVIMSPICIILFFYPACLLENKSFGESTKELGSKFLLVYTVDWCVWPAAQFLNFHYLHPKYRVIYINLVTMLYNIFLSYVKHQEVESR